MKIFNSLDIAQVLVETDTLEEASERVAAYVNRAIEKELSKATTVYGYEDYDFGVMVYFDDEETPTHYTHKARLVNIEKVSK